MKLLRPLGLVLGLLAALGVLATRQVVTREVEVAQHEASTLPEDPPLPPSATPRQRVIRRVLAAAGVAVLLLGLWKLAHAVHPDSYGWLVVWLLGGVVLHDAVIAPLLVVLRFGAHRGLARLPPLALAVLSGAFLVVGLLVLVVVPAIWAQHLGPANPTILPGPYALRLASTAAAVALGAVLAAVVVTLRARRATRRASDG